MAAPISAALAVVRGPPAVRQILLVHPGGPYWARKDEGAWSLPKGAPEPGEALLAAALREFVEETGFPAPSGPFRPLGEIAQRSGKRVVAFAAEGDCDPALLRSAQLEVEWPPRSGRLLRIPEIDRAGFFGRDAALSKVLPAQRPLVERALAPDHPPAP
jgi:predicted NUDIX family NTP pyrophosphohydrolase